MCMQPRLLTFIQDYHKKLEYVMNFLKKKKSSISFKVYFEILGEKQA